MQLLAVEVAQADTIERKIADELRVHDAGLFGHQRFRIGKYLDAVAISRAKGDLHHNEIRLRILLA